MLTSKIIISLPYSEIQQNFYSTESREGTKLMKKQCIEPVIRSLPYLMTRVYLDKHLPLSSRKNAKEIIEAVRTSFVQSMSGRSWIDESRNELIDRVNKIQVNIGYPDWILDDRNLINYYSILVRKNRKKGNSLRISTNLLTELHSSQ